MIAVEETAWLAEQELPRSAGTARAAASEASAEEAMWSRVRELYSTLRPALQRYLRGVGLSAEEAEDAVQEAFLRLAMHCREGGDQANLRSWLFRVAYNRSMDIHRFRRRSEDLSDVEVDAIDRAPEGRANPEWLLLRKERMKRVMNELSALTGRQRNGIVLRAKGLRYAEIASFLGVSEQRALQLVKRGLSRLAVGL